MIHNMEYNLKDKKQNKNGFVCLLQVKLMLEEILEPLGADRVHRGLLLAGSRGDIQCNRPSARNLYNLAAGGRREEGEEFNFQLAGGCSRSRGRKDRQGYLRPFTLSRMRFFPPFPRATVSLLIIIIII